MRKTLAVSTIVLVFGFGSACTDKSLIPVTGIHPSALPLLNTLTVMAGTVESIGQTATAYSFTPTPSNTPTRVPDGNELKKLISDTIKDQLIATLGAKITVVDVKFGPVGSQKFTDLYVEMNCISDNQGVCPSTQVIIAVVDSCKQKKKKALENIPLDTEVLTITIYDPGHSTQVVEADWPDVLAYINDDIPPDVFSGRIRYKQY